MTSAVDRDADADVHARRGGGPAPSRLAWEAAARRFEAAPPLSTLAGLAGVADLVINAVVVRTLPGGMDRGARLATVQVGELARNIAAVAAVLALGFLLYDLLRARGWAPPTRRVVFAAFAGLFLPAALLALVLPFPRVTTQIVFAGIASGTVLAVLLALTALRFPAGAVLRVGLGLLGLSTLLSFTAWTLAAVAGAAGVVVAGVARNVAELAHLAALPLVGLGVAAPPAPSLRSRLGRGLGLAAGLAIIVAFEAGRRSAGTGFPELLYGLTRWSLFLEEAPMVYGAVLGAAGGIAIAAWAGGGQATSRQGGLAVLLLLRAGLAPRTVAGVLALVLGTGLVTRAAIARGTRRLAARAPLRATPPPGS